MNNKAQVTPVTSPRPMPRPLPDYGSVSDLFARAIVRGSRWKGGNTVDLDVSGDCEDPVFRCVRARRNKVPVLQGKSIGIDAWGDRVVVPGRRREIREALPNVSDRKGFVFLEVNVEARCRRCASCRRHRAAEWRARMMLECDSARRTWFGTLTVAPALRVHIDTVAQLRSVKDGKLWHELDAGQQFAYRVSAAAPLVTKYFKRLRKYVALRYCLVAEPHDNGMVHFHVLIHEMGAPITKRLLDGQWFGQALGFCKFRLVQTGFQAANYAAKYISKTLGTRVRCSQGYGSTAVYNEHLPKAVGVSPKAGDLHREIMTASETSSMKCAGGLNNERGQIPGILPSDEERGGPKLSTGLGEAETATGTGRGSPWYSVSPPTIAPRGASPPVEIATSDGDTSAARRCHEFRKSIFAVFHSSGDSKARPRRHGRNRLCQ